jgi:tetratricopeptide (TPR) repeat protein
LSDRKYPKWLAPVAFVGFLALALLLSNQPAPAPQGGAMITNDAEYDAAKAKMEDLSLKTLQAYQAGQKLSEDDLKKLREAGEIVDKMILYSPVLTGLQFLSGKIHHVLGEDTIAADRFEQCTQVAANEIAQHPNEKTAIGQTAAECGYQLSQIQLLRGKIKEALAQADAAVKAVPNSPDYLTARASALNELRRTDEAKKDLAQALKLDPSNARARGLLRLISQP